MKPLMLLVLLMPLFVRAGMWITVEGEVKELRPTTVLLETKEVLVEVPREAVKSADLRLGKLVTATLDAHSPIKTWEKK